MPHRETILTFHMSAIVTLVTLIVYFWMATRVVAERRRTGIRPPVMTGDPRLERAVRAHVNTLEWLPIFLPSLWLFAFYWGDGMAAALGAVWLIGRVVYFLGYIVDAPKRAPGFFIQFCASAALLFGALGRAVYLLAAGS